MYNTMSKPAEQLQQCVMQLPALHPLGLKKPRCTLCQLHKVAVPHTCTHTRKKNNKEKGKNSIPSLN